MPDAAGGSSSSSYQYFELESCIGLGATGFDDCAGKVKSIKIRGVTDEY